MAERIPFHTQGTNVTVWPMAKVVFPEKIDVGSHVIIDDFSFLVGGEKTRIGNRVHIASFCSITGAGEFEMGDFSGLASGTRVITGNDDYNGGCLTNPTVPSPYRIAKRSFVRIGRHALIGANVVIMPGVTIGEGAIVGACSLVRHDCDPWTAYAGVPAKVLKVRPSCEIKRLERELAMQRGLKVSVCCLTYNHAAFIRQAIDSFLMQRTDFDFEILIHDDASTDGTREILKEYEARFPGVVKVMYQQKNTFSVTGKYPIVNLYRLAMGQYIAECDGDDFWSDPCKLQKQVDFLDANPGYVMAHHAYMILENGKTRVPHTDPPLDFSQVDLIRYTGLGYGIGYSTRMFRNVFSEETEKDIEVMAGDYPFVVYLGTIGSAKYIPGIAPSYYRRCHGGNSWCSLPPDEINKRTLEMQRSIYRWFKERGNSAHVEMRRRFANG